MAHFDHGEVSSTDQMNGVEAEGVVAWQLLLFLISLNDRLVRQEQLTHFAVVGALHDVVFAHERVGATQANDCPRSCFDRVVDQSHRQEAVLDNVSHCSSFAILPLLLEHLGSIREHEHRALINVVDSQHSVLSDVDLCVRFRIYFGLDLQALELILHRAFLKSPDSFDTMFVDCVPCSLSVVAVGDGSINEVNDEVAIGQVPDHMAIGCDDALGFL